MKQLWPSDLRPLLTHIMNQVIGSRRLFHGEIRNYDILSRSTRLPTWFSLLLPLRRFLLPGPLDTHGIHFLHLGLPFLLLLCLVRLSFIPRASWLISGDEALIGTTRIATKGCGGGGYDC